MIDCDSSVQGKRSCQALETNSGSGAQKLSFPGSCLPNFRLAIPQALVRAVMLQRTLTRNSHTALVASRSRKAIVNLSPRPQPRTPRLPSFDIDANPLRGMNFPLGPRPSLPACSTAGEQFVHADSATSVGGGWLEVHRTRTASTRPPSTLVPHHFSSHDVMTSSRELHRPISQHIGFESRSATFFEFCAKEASGPL